MKACGRTEQEPMRPTLPLLSGRARIHFTAASVSPTIWESGDTALAAAHFGGDVVEVAVAAATLALWRRGSRRSRDSGDARTDASSRCRARSAWEMVDEHDAGKRDQDQMAWPRVAVIGVALSPLMVTFSQVMRK